MERDEVVEYIERHDSDDEFDEVKFHCCRFEAVRVICVAMSSPRTPYELLKSDLKLTFSLRHMKRSCHGAPLHALLLSVIIHSIHSSTRNKRDFSDRGNKKTEKNAARKRESAREHLVVDAGHIELRFENHQCNANDTEHEGVVGQSLAFGEQHVAAGHTNAEMRSRGE